MVQIIPWIIAGYLVIGLLFAVPFVFKGMQRIDQDAKEASIAVRMLMIPGSVVFWPFLLSKWIRS